MKAVYIALILSLITLSDSVFAKTLLQGNVSEKVWNIDTARAEVMNGALDKVSLDNFVPQDSEYRINLQLAMQGGGLTKLKEGGYKQITVFNTGEYAVTIYTESEYINRINPPIKYYDHQGRLITVAFRVGKMLPFKTYAHCFGQYCQELQKPNGALIWVSFDNGDEGYLFEPNGELKSHWIGDTCYLTNGTVCGSRLSNITKF